MTRGHGGQGHLELRLAGGPGAAHFFLYLVTTQMISKFCFHFNSSPNISVKLLDQFFWCFHWFSFDFLLCLPQFPLVSLIAHLLTLSQCLCVCVGVAAPSCVRVYMFSGSLLYSRALVPASLFACCFPLLVQLHTVSLFTWVHSPSC